MTEKLKLPLKLVGNSWKYGSIYDSNGEMLAESDLECLFDVTEDNQEECEAKQTAMLEQIVKAVNMHTELVDAAFWMLDLIRLAGIGIDRVEYQKLKEISEMINKATKDG